MIVDIPGPTLLKEIPSETTMEERLLLRRLFSETWDGVGKVVEIGPFLGGTTRAIACGMMENPRLDAGAELHTFDRFEGYYSPDALRKTIRPLVENGTLREATADDLCRSGNFRGIFEAIHSPHPYYRLVRAHSAPLPEFPAEIAKSTALSVLAKDSDLGAVFVDGCKSWASTRYAMEFLLPRTRPHAPIIFQDFGWYTCFWISSFVHAMGELLEWQDHVDATYVFQLKSPVTAEMIARRFATSAREMGEGFFHQASAALLQRSRQQGDVRGTLIAQLHLVAALITLHRKAQAAEVLKKLDVREYAAQAEMIWGCIQSPTYAPGGKPIRWKNEQN